MSEEIKPQEQQPIWDFFALAAKVYKGGWIVSQVIIGIALVLLALSMTGTPLSHITDKRFWLQETKVSQSFELQLRQLELTETKIIPKLDDILSRLQSLESKVTNLEDRVSDHDRRLDQIEKKVK